MKEVLQFIQFLGGVFFLLMTIRMVIRHAYPLKKVEEDKQEQEKTPIPAVSFLEYSFEYIEESSVHNICMELNKMRAEGIGFVVIGSQLEGAKKFVLLEIIKERPKFISHGNSSQN